MGPETDTVEPVPAGWLSPGNLSGHVQGIQWIDVDVNFITAYCYGLVVPTLIWKQLVAPFMVFRGGVKIIEESVF